MDNQFNRGPWTTREESPGEWVTRYEGVKVASGESEKESKQAAMRWLNGNGTTPNMKVCKTCDPMWEPHFTHVAGDPNQNG